MRRMAKHTTTFDLAGEKVNCAVEYDARVDIMDNPRSGCELPEYRIIQRTMHGGRVWYVPQVTKGTAEGWSDILRFDVTDPRDAARGMEKSLRAIENHKNHYAAEETPIWQESQDAKIEDA